MNIALLGYGKMGKAIERLSEAKHSIVLKISQANASGLTLEALAACDVAIEFSTPDTAFHNIELCLKAGIPVVSGTTGWLDQLPAIEALVKEKEGSFLYAANFSLGVNLFFAINAYAAKLMAKFPEYHPAMEELHHIHKTDAPSGTALRLAQDIMEQQAQVKSWSLEAGRADTMHINAIRQGEIPGTHMIEYASNADKISLRHEAFTRDSFAQGALLAAEWIIGKKGIHSMSDLLKI